MENPDNRLPTSLVVDVALRTVELTGDFYVIIKKGCPIGGTIMLKQVSRDDGNAILTQTRDMDGNLIWMNSFDDAKVDETTMDAYIQRAIASDPDLWVVEVESKQRINPFEDE